MGLLAVFVGVEVVLPYDVRRRTFQCTFPKQAEFPDPDEAERRADVESATGGRFQRHELTTTGSC